MHIQDIADSTKGKATRGLKGQNEDKTMRENEGYLDSHLHLQRLKSGVKL